MVAIADADTRAYLTVKEAAALLRVHTRTIKSRIRSRQLPAKKLTGGRTLLIDRRDVLGLLTDARPENVEEAAGDGPKQTIQARPDTERSRKQ